MTLGDRGNDVEKAQAYLIKNGLLSQSEGYYGVSTKRAVIKLQHQLGVAETGEWDDVYETLYDLKVNRARMRVARAQTSSPTRSTAFSSGGGTTSSKTEKNPKGNGAFTYDYITGYVYNLNTGTFIQFGVATPEEVSDSNSANFEDQEVKGRSSPFKAYSSSGPRSISFTIELVADYCKEGIVKTVNSFRALVYPHKQTVIVEPRCRFKLGTFLNVTGVPEQVDVTWKKPYKDGIYTLADVSITLSEVEDVGKFAKEVEAE